MSTLRVSLNTLFWLGLIAFCCAPQAARAFPQRLGDLDEDTAPTVLDIVRVVNHFTGATRLSPSLEPFADVDQDGAVNETDAAVVAKAILGVHPLPNVPLARVRETSPAHGEGSVAVTRETIFRLNFPLATNAVVSNTNLWAQFGGRRILSRVELSPDRRTLTLFYLEPLPAAARIRVTLNGSGVNDFLGRPIDADGDGIAGGSLIVDFDTLNLAVVAGTVVSGRVFASELAQGASPEQSVNVPLAGVTITVDGQEQTMRAVTDQFGNFRLDPAPAGEFFVHVDGRTASNYNPTNAYYPFVGKKWQSIAGEEVSIGNIYLPLIAEGSLVAVSPTNNTVITFPDSVLAEHPELQGVTVTIPPNSLYSDGGVRGGRVGIAPVAPDRLPEPLPPGLEFPLVITVQTDGPSNFDRPVPVCFPNLPDPRTGQVKPPGAKSGLWSFNHDVGRWEVVGSMTVSADGRFVCSDPGVGILQPGWHGEADGTSGSGGSTRTRNPKNPTKPRPTATQEHAQNDEDACCCCSTDDAVFVHNGEERLQRIDLSIPGRGDLHFEMRRWYRSRLDYNGPLGRGWSFTYAEGLYLEPNGDITRANGRAHVDQWIQKPDGSFEAPHGNFRTMIRNPDGTVVLREANGMKRYYRSDGRLFSHEDRFGNRMLFDYDATGNLARVIDVYGREIEFFFQSFPDGVDRLVRVRDFIGREVLYSYDERGNLISVRSPVVVGTSTGNDFPQGRTERYTYSSGFAHPDLNHNLLTVTLPEEVAKGGPPAMRWTYGTNPTDPLTFDKVLTETVGGTNASGIGAGGTRTFTYIALNESEPPGNRALPRLQVTVTERNGNVTQYFVNEDTENIITRQLTRGLRPNEPPYYETRAYYNEDGLVSRQVFPEGNQVVFVYDESGPRESRQNRTEVRRVADAARGGGEDIVTTFTYEPLYNQIASVTGPLGNAPNYQPPLGTASPARYTTRYFYDYQESNLPVEQAIAFNIDLSQVPRGLGDLNGDGRVNQLFGHVVRVQMPSVQLRPDSHEAAVIGSTTQQIITESQWNDRGQPIATIDPEGNVTRMTYYREDDPNGDGKATWASYVVLTDRLAGYLQSVITDAETSRRRRSVAPAPLALEARYTYNDVGTLIAMRNPRGVATAFEVTPLNETVQVVRGADVSEARRTGQLLGNEESKRYVTRFFYDANGRRVRRETENRDSNTEGVGEFIEQTFTYDILGKLLQRNSEVGANSTQVWQFRYDPDGSPILTIKPEGNRDTGAYDERNLLFRVTRGFGSPDASTMQVDYDRNGNRQRIIDARDNDGDGQPEATTMVHDGFDRMVRVVDPLGNESRRTYDIGSRLIQLQMWGHPANNPAGAKVLHAHLIFHHDELDRVFQMDSALFVAAGYNPARPVALQDQNNDGWVTSRTEYDALSRITFDIQDDVQTTRSLYDGADRVIEVVDHIGNRRRTIYDRNSNPIAGIDIDVSAEGLVANEMFTTTYVYDQLDRLVRVSDNAGQTARFAYDSRNNLVQRSDPEGPLMVDALNLFPGQINSPGNTVTFVHDGLDRTIKEIIDLRTGGTGGGLIDTSNPDNPDGKITLVSEYDGNSRLIGRIDDNGNHTSFGYDALDRKTSHRFADGKSYIFTYDEDDNVRRIVDPNGTVLTRSYDVLNRIVEETVVRAPGVLGTTRATFGYDGVSRQVYATDDNGNATTSQHTVEYIYNSVGHVLEERQDGKAIASQYTGDGKRLQVRYPGGRTISRTFDTVDRIKSIRDGANTLATTDWIGPAMRELRRMNGNATALSFLNDAGNQAAVGYDAVRRLVGLRVLGPGGAPIVNREYAYNRASQRIGERRVDDSGLVDRYTYDSAYRITRSEFDLDGEPGAAFREIAEVNYRLDGVGNRRIVDKLFETVPRRTDAYAVNEVNEYTSVGGVPQVSDENGNLIDDGRRLFSYDYKDRLVTVRDKVSGIPIANYEYLSGGRRVRKILFTQTLPATIEKTISYFWDGSQEVEEQDGASGGTEATFVWSPVYADELVQYQNSAGSFYTHQDARANVVAITDGTGQVVERVRYDDFGSAEIRTASGQTRPQSAIANAHLFQGRRLDPETGLYYFRSRYYDPVIGRFLQRDPVSDPKNLGNAYTFVGNSPATSVDPMGLQADIAPVTSSTYPRKQPPTKAEIARSVAERVYARLWSINRKWFYLRLGIGATTFTKMREKCLAEDVGGFPTVVQNDPRLRHMLGKTARRMAEIATEFGWGNCQESAAAVATELHDQGFSNVEIMKTLGTGGPNSGEHVFVVLDRAAGSDPGDPSTWGPNALIVDGWEGTVIDPLNDIDDLAGVGLIQSFGVLPNPGDPDPGPLPPPPTPPQPCKKEPWGPQDYERLRDAAIKRQEKLAADARRREEEMRQRAQQDAKRTADAERGEAILRAGEARQGTLEHQKR